LNDRSDSANPVAMTVAGEPPLPECNSELLQAMTIDQLVEWLLRHEDRVPRQVIDECARRGPAMEERLRALIYSSDSWCFNNSVPADWLLLHAVHILGLQDSEAAGCTLMEALLRAGEKGHDFLLDWIDGHWTVLFRNKPAEVLARAQQLAADRSVKDFVRTQALEILLEQATRDTPERLEERIDQVAAAAGDATDDWNFRMLAACMLLQFPRLRHRLLLEQCCEQQRGPHKFFDLDSVNLVYAKGVDEPQWQRFDNPWQFYDEQEIQQRQQRWTDEDSEEEIPLPEAGDHPLEERRLPQLSAELLSDMDDELLTSVISVYQDRVPRDVIDECLKRGQPVVDRLIHSIQDNANWAGWALIHQKWELVHAVNILGLVDTDAAGHALIDALVRSAKDPDSHLQECVSNYWPALFRNKPPGVVTRLLELVRDRTIDPFARAFALDVVLDHAARGTPKPLEELLDDVAAWAADESDDERLSGWEFRMLAGMGLLEFPRPRHRLLLEQLCQQQSTRNAFFNLQDVERAYSRGADEPSWQRFTDPWQFYEPAEIERREQRWAEDAEQARISPRYEPVEQYIRTTPKIGRNDPCPCGSGKKYKKCCIDTER